MINGGHGKVIQWSPKLYVSNRQNPVTHISISDL